MKHIQIEAGHRTRIIHRQLSSLVTTYTFEVAPTLQDGYLAGTIEVKGSDWIFPKGKRMLPLQASNSVTAGMWDMFFSVYVIPEVDVIITLPTSSLGSLWLILLIGLAVCVVGVAIAIFLITERLLILDLWGEPVLPTKA